MSWPSQLGRISFKISNMLIVCMLSKVTSAYPKYKGFLCHPVESWLFFFCFFFFGSLVSISYMSIIIQYSILANHWTVCSCVTSFEPSNFEPQEKNDHGRTLFFPPAECGFRGVWRAMKRKASSRNLVVTILLRILPLAPCLLKLCSYSRQEPIMCFFSQIPLIEGSKFLQAKRQVFCALVLWWTCWCCLVWGEMRGSLFAILPSNMPNW